MSANRSATDEIALEADLGLAAAMEVDLDRAASLVPRGLSPVESRPGTGLASLLVFRFVEGADHGPGYGCLETYADIVLGLHVAPGPGADMADLGLWVLRAAATTRAGSEFLADVHRLPVEDEPVEIAVAGERYRRIVASDRRGRIVMVDGDRPLRGRPVRPMEGALRAEVFAGAPGRIVRYREVVLGTVDRYRPNRGAVRLRRHPFWCGLGLEESPVVVDLSVSVPGRRLLQVAERPVEFPGIESPTRRRPRR